MNSDKVRQYYNIFTGMYELEPTYLELIHSNAFKRTSEKLSTKKRHYNIFTGMYETEPTYLELNHNNFFA